MRTTSLMILSFALALFTAGCDESTGTDAGPARTDAGGGGGTDAGGGGTDAGGGGTDAGGGGTDAGPGTDAGAGTAAPVITRIAWAPDGACSAGSSSDFIVTITATDADTPSGSLTYSGSVSSCGSITGAASTMTCPNAGTYSGTATVTDPEANSDTETFNFGPCDTGGIDL